jgi:hypothetical protein
MTSIPNEPERKAVIDAVLNLFGASKTESFLLPIPDTSPQLWIAAGEMEEIRSLVELSQPAAVEGWKSGVEDVAKMIDKKAEDYAAEHGHDDLGSLSFGTGRSAEYMTDYHSSLVELAEEVREMHQPAAPTPPSAPVQQGMREAFESYQLGRFQYADITRDTDGRYWHAPMELEWETWQSALSTSPLLDKNDQTEGE